MEDQLARRLLAPHITINGFGTTMRLQKTANDAADKQHTKNSTKTAHDDYKKNSTDYKKQHSKAKVLFRN